jgi:hypothetical protein
MTLHFLSILQTSAILLSNFSRPDNHTERGLGAVLKSADRGKRGRVEGLTGPLPIVKRLEIADECIDRSKMRPLGSVELAEVFRAK